MHAEAFTVGMKKKLWFREEILPNKDLGEP